LTAPPAAEYAAASSAAEGLSSLRKMLLCEKDTLGFGPPAPPPRFESASSPARTRRPEADTLVPSAPTFDCRSAGRAGERLRLARTSLIGSSVAEEAGGIAGAGGDGELEGTGAPNSLLPDPNGWRMDEEKFGCCDEDADWGRPDEAELLAPEKLPRRWAGGLGCCTCACC